MTTRIATLKAFINISNQQSCVEALCLWLISPLLYSIKIACIEPGTNPLRRAIRWGFHGSSHPFAAPICGKDDVGIVIVSLLSGEKANITPSQCSMWPILRKIRAADQVGLWLLSPEWHSVPHLLKAWVPMVWLQQGQAYNSYTECASSITQQSMSSCAGQQRAESISWSQRFWTNQRWLTFRSSSVTHWMDLQNISSFQHKWILVNATPAWFMKLAM